LNKLRSAVAWLSGLCLAGAVCSVVALAIALMIEVVARYGMNAPTLWAHDVSRFLTALSFLLAAAWCQHSNANIRVDVFAARIGKKRQAILESCFLAFLLLPALAAISHASLRRAISSFSTGEVDPVSPWGPRVWPFFAVVAFALIALWLQCAMTLVDSIMRATGSLKDEPAAPNTDKVEPI